MTNLKFAFRQLFKNPGFTAIAVLTLALGIGANTAVFSVVNGVLLRPLPYPSPGQLVKIRKEAPPSETMILGGGNLVGGHEFAAWREHSQTLAQIAAYGSDDRSLTGRGTAERVRCGTATGSLFPLLGVRPHLGRFFLAEEEVPNGARVAVLTHGLWKRRFGGDPNILDQTLPLDGELYTIVGVLPAGFQFPDPNEIWVPMRLARGPEIAGGGVQISLLQVMARLKPGVSIGQAQSELDLISSRVDLPRFQPPADVPHPPDESAPLPPVGGAIQIPFPAEGQGVLPGPTSNLGVTPRPAGAPQNLTQSIIQSPPDNIIDQGAGPVAPEPPTPMTLSFGGGKIQLVGLHEHLVANVRRSVWVMMGAVAFVLLIACANVANLLLTRAVTRRREIAVRLALGAPRARVIRQFLIESTLLALGGGVLGMLFAWWGVRTLSVLIPAGTEHLQPVTLDATVLFFTVAVALGTGLIFGLAPAVQSATVSVNDALKEGSQSAGEGRSRHRLRSLLVIAETALALVLLVGAGLLINSFIRLRSIHPGFNPDNLLTFQLNLEAGTATSAEARTSFIRRLREELSVLPGVRSVAMTDHLPLTPYSIMTAVSVAGEPREKYSGKPAVSLCAMTENYFETLGIAVKEGRALTAADQSGRNIVVNERFAREYFPGESAVGKQLNDFAGNAETFSIVGVVADTRQDGFEGGVTPEVYKLSPERAPEFFSTALKFQGNQAALARAVRERVQSLDSNLVVYDLMTLRERLEATVTPRRANLMLLGTFAGLALVLAAVGIYGVMSFIVSQRTREIGVRLALGAEARDVVGLVVRQGLVLVLTGLIFGVIAALLAARSLSAWLFGISSADPLTLTSVSVLLLTVGALACWLPARRASQVDPTVALRSE